MSWKVAHLSLLSSASFVDSYVTGANHVVSMNTHILGMNSHLTPKAASANLVISMYIELERWVFVNCKKSVYKSSDTSG